MNKILQKFLNSDTKIKSQEKLEQYIEHCINNKKAKIKSKTSYHHILPQALFPEYKNLKENPWNGVHLLHSDHYYAHWLFTEAIDDYGQLSAFCAMHNKDMKLGKIEEKDLISPEEFQKKMEERGNKHSLLWLDEEYKEKTSNKISRTRSSKEWKETKGKEALLKFKATISSEEGMLIKKKAAQKRNKELNKNIMHNNIEIKKKDMISITKLLKYKEDAEFSYDVYSGDNLIFEGISDIEVKRIYKKLINTSKENYLGKSSRIFNKLEKINKKYLSSLYIKKNKIKKIKDEIHNIFLERIFKDLETKLKIKTEVYDLYKINSKDAIIKNIKPNIAYCISQKYKKLTKDNYLGKNDINGANEYRGIYFVKRFDEPNEINVEEISKEVHKTEIVPFENKINYKRVKVQIYNENGYVETLYQNEAHKKYAKCITTGTKEKPLGHSIHSLSSLKRTNKIHLKGFYSNRID